MRCCTDHFEFMFICPWSRLSSAPQWASFLVSDSSIPGEEPGRHTLQPMSKRKALRKDRLKSA
ncbi:hypothetical protein EYF80_058426 [Liparis tanakae]|uniref:Uncharacterized protein n=1 Tax=Liparis tanakae TaxID=230148 RepID=A0A4Z2ERM0_9TELE|nr:hypothetical protein EYF80_058426 [Liparis tanakae]